MQVSAQIKHTKPAGSKRSTRCSPAGGRLSWETCMPCPFRTCECKTLGRRQINQRLCPDPAASHRRSGRFESTWVERSGVVERTAGYKDTERGPRLPRLLRSLERPQPWVRQRLHDSDSESSLPWRGLGDLGPGFARPGKGFVTLEFSSKGP